MAAFLISVTAAPGAHGGTSAAIDTTGATLLVVGVSWYGGAGGTASAASDNKGNTYTPLTIRSQGDSRHRFFYCLNPATVGTGHTFTISGTSIYGRFYAYAFSGTEDYGFQVEGGTGGTASPTAGGSVTPIADGAVLLTGECTPDATAIGVSTGGFTVTSHASSPGATVQAGIAYYVQPTAAAINPTWTWTVGTSATIAVSTVVFSAPPPPLPAVSTTRTDRAVFPTTAVIGDAALPLASVLRLGTLPARTPGDPFLSVDAGGEVTAGAIASGDLPAGAVAAHATTHQDGGADELALDGSQITTGTVVDARLSSNVALENVANVFTENQTLTKIGPHLYFNHTAGGADTRVFSIRASGTSTNLYFESRDDALAIQTQALLLSRAGNVSAAGTFTERGRTVAMGEWTTAALGTYLSGFTGDYRWSIVGKTLFLTFEGNGTTGAVGSFVLYLPAGIYGALTTTATIFNYVSGVGWEPGFARNNPSANYLHLHRLGAAGWPAGNNTVSGSVVVAIQ